jgi:hypothetical protein
MVAAASPFNRCQVEDLAVPFLRGEAELRGEARDGLDPVRQRVILCKQRKNRQFK